MAIIIDTNVILDIITEDPAWSAWSESNLIQYKNDGLLVNPIIFSELCGSAESYAEVDRILRDLDIQLIEMPRQALFLAAKIFLQYRKLGGAKSSTLSDFFVGAHAQSSGLPLLTRDTARYLTHFPTVRLIAPEVRPN